VEAAGDLAQLIQHAGCPGDGAVELRVELAELGWYRRLCCAQVQRQRDQPLLGAVVQVSPDTSAGLVGGGDDPRARRGELGPTFSIGDGGRDELGELGQPLLGVLGQSFAVQPDAHGAPDPTLDHDRAGHRRADALGGSLGQARRWVVYVVASRAARRLDRCHGQVGVRLAA
jgi:hypothetical protein